MLTRTILKKITPSPEVAKQDYIAKNSVQHKPFVFISYAHSDCKDFARRLHNDLKSDGIDVWLDLYDLSPGANGMQR